MKSFKKLGLLMGCCAVISIFILTGCQKVDPVAKYYKDVVSLVQIDKVFQGSVEKFSAANSAYQEAIIGNKPVDTAILTENMNEAIKILEEGKKRVEALKIEDEKAKEYNEHLLDGINNQISGYQDMLQGMVHSNITLIDSGNEKIAKSGEDIDKWMSGSTTK